MIWTVLKAIYKLDDVVSDELLIRPGNLPASK